MERACIRCSQCQPASLGHTQLLQLQKYSVCRECSDFRTTWMGCRGPCEQERVMQPFLWLSVWSHPLPFSVAAPCAVAGCSAPSGLVNGTCRCSRCGPGPSPHRLCSKVAMGHGLGSRKLEFCPQRPAPSPLGVYGSLSPCAPLFPIG